MTSKLSPREAAKVYQVSRATLMKALLDGTISATKTDAGHWQIDASELARLYQPRAAPKSKSRAKPDNLNRDDPDQNLPEPQPNSELLVRLARAEAALAAEREKVELLERNLDDLRRILPPPDAKPRRRWWPW